ncbi:unnamed protein product [Cylicocyclus nassatus]|uniref:LITAF domain-containing protein n=1 Tax=Cylicocyclus nassatus TaxID=53992 RepID=A0AA36HAA2_CYLNA|nr:unnamed protein product [Cylicocyclus nassatus]
MLPTPPPPYPESETAANEAALEETIVPEKNDGQKQPIVKLDLPTTSPQLPTNTPYEMKAMKPPQIDQMTPITPLPYTTAPNTPMPMQGQSLPFSGQPGMSVPGMTSAGMSNVGAPTIQPSVAYAAGPAAMQGYSTPMSLPQMYSQQPAIPMNPIGMPGGVATAPSQAGGINLVVNTNANANSDSNGRNGQSNPPRPAPRPCPKCRLGYITRGQARFREMCIKILAYSTICCTCLLPLKLLNTNYVDKCSYCGEEYGFRGELFEKPKAPKM